MSIQAQPKDYAAAIYDLALETWTRQLGSIQETIRRDAALRAVLDDPGRSTQDKLEQLDQAVPGGWMTRSASSWARFWKPASSTSSTPSWSNSSSLARRRPELKMAQVTSAVPLTDAEEESIRAKLTDRFGSDLEFQFEVDAALHWRRAFAGGRPGDRRHVAGKLAALRDRLAA